MSRYDREENPDEVRDSSVHGPAEPSSGQDTSDARGHGGGSGALHDPPPRPEIRTQEQTASARDPELRERDHPRRERSYDLRYSEVQTLTDIGAFRGIRTEDLVEHRYDGEPSQAHRDLKHLVEQGLVQRRTTYRERDVYLALTRNGRRHIEHNRPANTASRQAFYHGFVKRREARHDAAIYRLYQRENQRITQAGGKVNRVILDFELKASINRELAKIHSLPTDEQLSRRAEIAEAHGLTVVSGKILLPDLRLEYETPDREQTKVDVELLSGE
jgi:DNA-binding MarR family transcriptional regulator